MIVANVTSLKGAWVKLLTAGADLLVVQQARCTAAELTDLARPQNCQVVFGAEVEGVVLLQLLLGMECCGRATNALAAQPTTSSGK